MHLNPGKAGEKGWENGNMEMEATAAAKEKPR